MAENLTLVKGVLQRSLEMLREIPAKSIPVDELEDIQIRIQISQNALSQKEEDIWLLTNEGKEFIGNFGVATIKLLSTIERYIRATSSEKDLFKDIKAALGEVELHVRILNEKTH